jgi:REP element-mobilizing transposase RayT
MSWVSIWVHLVFTTKNREKILVKEIRNEVFQHIKQNADKKGIWIDSVNGFMEHVHCLLSLNNDQSISQVTQLIKGESSFWINNNRLVNGKFNWQDDYWAVSVSESHLKSVRKYIHEQEEHHRVISFDEEIERFMKKYGWVYVKG